MKNVLHKYKSNADAVAAVEFALIAPVLVLVLFGIIAYGIFFGAANAVQQLAANSARAAMGGLDIEERQALVDAYVESFLSRDGLLLDDYLTVTVEHHDEKATLLAVKVTYDARGLPVWNLYDGLPLPEKTIERDALIRAGGY